MASTATTTEACAAMKKNGLADLAQLASLSGLVTTPAAERRCPGCGQPLEQCRCEALAQERAQKAALKGAAGRVCQEIMGRRGNGLAVVKGLRPLAAVLDALGKQLKAACGSGFFNETAAIE